MSWRKEIAAVMEQRPERYKYIPSGDDFDPEFPIATLFGAIRISRPLVKPLSLEGTRDFVILPPTRLRRRTPVVVIDRTPSSNHIHAHLSGTADVFFAGQVTPEKGLVTNQSGHYEPPEESLEVARAIMSIYKLPFTRFENYRTKYLR
jgi:hypothetical protein